MLIYLYRVLNVDSGFARIRILNTSFNTLDCRLNFNALVETGALKIELPSHTYCLFGT
jgi:hypothetical protein